jgi:hypothetical protein
VTTRPRLALLVFIALLPIACQEEGPPAPILIHQAVGERERCPEAEPWSAIARTQLAGCGIGFGEGRLNEAISAASADPSLLEDEYWVLDSEEDEIDAAKYAVVFSYRSNTDVAWTYDVGARGFDTCEPGEIEVPDDCLGCVIECEAALAGCDDCCEPPEDCSEDEACCPGQLCVEQLHPLFADADRECVCETDEDCGPNDCCVEVDGSDEKACAYCPP